MPSSENEIKQMNIEEVQAVFKAVEMEDADEVTLNWNDWIHLILAVRAPHDSVDEKGRHFFNITTHSGSTRVYYSGEPTHANRSADLSARQFCADTHKKAPDAK